MVTGGNGITVAYRGVRISLDPKREPSSQIVFVSHAHIDHLYSPSHKRKIITSRETALLARHRGYDLGSTVESWDGLELVDSGHILGSKGLLIAGELFYTGDIAGKRRAFLDKGKAVKCRTMILETTYGDSSYRLPAVEKIIHEGNKLIADMYDRGIPVILMGYPLGKAQVLSYLFSNWDPIYLHGSVEKMNNIHLQMGVELGENLKSYSTALEEGVLDRKPWILITPFLSGRTNLIRSLKKKYGAVTIAFSGWCIDEGFKHQMAFDYGFPLTDHCDYDELIELVKKCGPEKVYTTHGFASQFASRLRNLGFDAEPILSAQKSLSDFTKGE